MHERKPCLVIALALIWLAPFMDATAQSTSSVSWKDPIEQWSLIKFSHKLHLEEMGADCDVCHEAARESTTATDLLLPEMDTCGDCHDVEAEDECLKCHIDEDRMEAYESPNREVIFNHLVHIEQGLGCQNCHKNLEQSERPTTATLPTMAQCLNCHNDIKASRTCETCHSQPEALYPETHRRADWVKEHKRVVKVSGPEDTCLNCHTLNDCQSCHAETALQTTKTGFIRPLTESRPTFRGAKPQVNQRVHELNYLFIHSIDFRSKRSDCFTCHQQQSFCSDCHRKNQDAGFSSPVPVTHKSPDFTRLGVGSGGGLHATLAKKDIESCAACHDLEAADPNCILCHVDRTPGVGNDPKTHPKSFRNDEGDWHHDSSSLCFQCHTNTRKAGLGFCGYCHGVK